MASEKEARSSLVDWLVGRTAGLDDAPGDASPPIFVLRAAPGMGKSQILHYVPAHLDADRVPVRRAAGGT